MNDLVHPSKEHGYILGRVGTALGRGVGVDAGDGCVVDSPTSSSPSPIDDPGAAGNVRFRFTPAAKVDEAVGVDGAITSTESALAE
jgi:hypothetical protein